MLRTSAEDSIGAVIQGPEIRVAPVGEAQLSTEEGRRRVRPGVTWQAETGGIRLSSLQQLRDRVSSPPHFP